jgi:hypothetical protein
MPKPGVYRSPWQDFPDVVIQTTVHKLRSRPAYDQAKRGVGEAAFKVVQELIKPEKIPFAFDMIVPVMQFDRDKPNALPLVYATALAKHFDAYLEIGVRQANVVSHTFADAQTRILGQPMFIGKIQPGSRVLIVAARELTLLQERQLSLETHKRNRPTLTAMLISTHECG